MINTLVHHYTFISNSWSLIHQWYLVGLKPLTAEDIAEEVVWCAARCVVIICHRKQLYLQSDWPCHRLSRPAHVNVAELYVSPLVVFCHPVEQVH